MKLRILIYLLTFFSVTSVSAEQTPNEKQARRIFDEAYEKVFGPQGCSLEYKVNLLGLYKTEGSVWFKEKKQKYLSKGSNGWNDGVTSYIVKNRKKVVEIHHATKKNKHEDKFEFHADNYSYHIATDPKGLLITLKAKKGVKGPKEVRALLDRSTYAPIHVKAKIGIIWANIAVSNFHSGDVNDEVFVFPRAKYSHFKFVDKRKED